MGRGEGLSPSLPPSPHGKPSFAVEEPVRKIKYVILTGGRGGGERESIFLPWFDVFCTLSLIKASHVDHHIPVHVCGILLSMSSSARRGGGRTVSYPLGRWFFALFDNIIARRSPIPNQPNKISSRDLPAQTINQTNKQTGARHWGVSERVPSAKEATHAGVLAWHSAPPSSNQHYRGRRPSPLCPGPGTPVSLFVRQSSTYGVSP